MSLVFGTCPDSWGVWLPEHKSQPPWPRFLDEMAEAGYTYLELGPLGYLPTDPEQLATELGSRGLVMLAGTLMADLHRPEQRDELRKRARQVCRLVSVLGGRFLVLIPDLYVDIDGEQKGPTSLDPLQWQELVATSNELGRLAKEEFDMTLVFHPHADTVVQFADDIERLLVDTDPDTVKLCLDTGHVAYRDGDAVGIMKRWTSRVPYLHLKSVDAGIKRAVAEEALDFPSAVRRGVMCEPDRGIVDFAALADVMNETAWDGWAVVEQDMFPLDSLRNPLPIAKRTRVYYEDFGWTTNHI